MTRSRVGRGPSRRTKLKQNQCVTVVVRIPKVLDKRLRALADAEVKTVTEIVIRALSAELDGDPPLWFRRLAASTAKDDEAS